MYISFIMSDTTRETSFLDNVITIKLVNLEYFLMIIFFHLANMRTKLKSTLSTLKKRICFIHLMQRLRMSSEQVMPLMWTLQHGK